MNYKKIYNSLITSRMLLNEKRKIEKNNGNYFEKHHIIPKCKGGDNSKDNLLLLTAREHYLAHWLLWLIYRDRQMALAFHKMSSINKNQKRIISSKDYERVREVYRETNIGNTYGKAHKGRKISNEQRKAQSIKMKNKFNGDDNPFYGKTHTDEFKNKLSEKRKNMKNEEIHNYKGDKLVFKNGVFICKFTTVKEVSEFMKCSEANIKNVLGGKQKTAKGYVIKHSNK